MANFPCPNLVTCPPGTNAEDAALRNLTAELPDRFTYFGQFQCSVGPTNPAYAICESVVSQRAADLCAALCLPDDVFVNAEQVCSNACGAVVIPAGLFLGLSQANANQLAHSYACAALGGLCVVGNDEYTCTIDCGNGSSQSYTITASKILGATHDIANSIATQIACNNASAQCFGVLFFNSAQTCRVQCSNGAFVSYDLAAGIVAGLTQAEADSKAQAFACTLAFLACDTLPPLVGNTAQTCTQDCAGQNVGYVVPAGSFLALTQEDADAEAFAYACQVLSGACQRDVVPHAMNVGNTTQSCSVNCPIGGTFTAIVRPGTFRGDNLAIANAAAASYACTLANDNLLCLNSIDANACSGGAYAAFVTNSPDISTSITSGILPTGLTISQGVISGIPTIPGTYAFTVTANSGSGSAQRSYTITVFGFLLTTLPDGTVGTSYSGGVITGGYTNPYYFISVGALPDGLTINPGSGAITGTPTTAGEFDFVVAVSEGVDGFTCTQPFTLTIASVLQPIAWWAMETVGATISDVSGHAVNLALVAFSNVASATAGKVNLAATIGDVVSRYNTGSQVLLGYQGGDINIFGWSIITSPGTSAFTTQTISGIWDETDPVTRSCALRLSGNNTWRLDAETGLVLTGGIAVTPFLFFRLHYNSTTNKWGVAFNNAAPTYEPGNSFLFPAVSGSFDMRLGGSFLDPGSVQQCDELCVFFGSLSQADIDSIYNGGAGRTFP